VNLGGVCCQGHKIEWAPTCEPFVIPKVLKNQFVCRSIQFSADSMM